MEATNIFQAGSVKWEFNSARQRRHRDDESKCFVEFGTRRTIRRVDNFGGFFDKFVLDKQVLLTLIVI